MLSAAACLLLRLTARRRRRADWGCSSPMPANANFQALDLIAIGAQEFVVIAGGILSLSSPIRAFC